MLRVAVHLETHLRDRPFAERWRASKALGYAGCEFVWRGKNPEEVVALRRETGLQVTCLGGTTGGKAGGGRPALTDPGNRELLAADVTEAIAAAKAYGCTRLVMVPGDVVEGWTQQRLHDEVVASLKSVAPLVEKAGVTIVVEPLNSRVDHKTCWCDTSNKGIAIVDAVGSPAVKILYDLYHMAVMGDDLAQVITAHHDAIGYYHIAGAPGRHEPTGGEVDFAPALDAIVRSGYDGFIGLEYGPALPPEESLRAVRVAFPDRG